MRADDLRAALDDLAGADPPIDAALQRVTTRARNARMRTRVGIAALSSLIAAGVVVGAAQVRTTDRHVSVVAPPRSGSVENLTWTRVAAPGMTINRVVTADGRTFAVGSSADGRAAIAELAPDGSLSSIDPTAGYDRPRLSGTVNDLVAIPGALVAVGRSAAAKDALGIADAWRSTDGGRTWDGVALETRGLKYSTIDRVVFSDGAVYAVGTQSASNTDPADRECPIAIWRSPDGTNFHFTSAPSSCGGVVDAVTGPAGLLVITPNNATAWHKAGADWIPRPISQLTNSHVTAVAADARGYVAVGSVAPKDDVNDFNGAIWWSADGKTWTRTLIVTGPGLPPNRRASVEGVVRSAAGWVAVGWEDRVDNPAVSDALLWTSLDGKTWRRSTRDGDVFEQYATAQSLGVTANGFAIRGIAHMDWTGPPHHLIAGDQTMWLGSTAPPETALGTVDGVVQEVGGPPPGLARNVRGTFIATGPGTSRHGTTDENGTFTAQLPPGTYRIVGHSPVFGDGKYDCPAGDPIIVRANSVTHATLTCPVR